MQVIKSKSSDTFSARLVRQSDLFQIQSVTRGPKAKMQIYKLQIGNEPLTDIKLAKTLFSSHCQALIVAGDTQ